MTQPPMQPGYGSAPQKGSGLAVASLVLGIVSLILFCFWPISAPCAVIAIILGIIANNQVKAGTATGGGMARTGMILGIIALALSIALIIAARAGLHFLGNKANEWQRQMEEQQRRHQSTTTQEIFHLSADGILRVGHVWPTR